MKLFLDDIRNPQECISYMYKRIGELNPIYAEEWSIVRSYDQFVEAIHKFFQEITHISFDHDLADLHYHDSMYEGEEAYNQHLASISEKTGYDCAVFLKEYTETNGYTLPVMFVHSMNPVGTDKIIKLFNNKNKY